MHVLILVLWQLFSWPNGVLVGNLLASIVWQPAFFWHLYRKMNQHHDEVVAKLSEPKVCKNCGKET